MIKVAPERLAVVFVEIADTLVADFDLIEFLHVVTTRTRELVNATAAGLLLADHHGVLQFMAASSEEARLLELFQAQVHEGPCQDAYLSGTAVVNTDLNSARGRWPTFAPRAVEAGYQSVHAFPMRLRDMVIGALNVFGSDTVELDEDDTHIVQALADIATIALLQERSIRRGEALTEQLQAALNSRIVIEQAKGVISQLYDVDVNRAFEMLRSYARRHQRQLVAVASSVVTDPGYGPNLNG